MADREHLSILRKGVKDWNDWYRDYCDPIHHRGGYTFLKRPDLSGWDGDFLRTFDWVRFCTFEHRFNCELADPHERYVKGELSMSETREGWLRLDGIEMESADLRSVNWAHIRLRGANLADADLSEANLSGADLTNANLAGAKLIATDLTGASLRGADLSRSNCSAADFSGADMSRAVMVGTILDGANLTHCYVYGLSAWDVRLDGSLQKNLRISPPGQPDIVVDDLEVAQFVYLLLNRQKLRSVLTTMGERAVLVLGRFTERKALLDGIADRLRALGYLPIIFDFERPTHLDLTETIKTLAGLSLFVIADITNPRSVPLELQATVPDYMVPFVAIVERSQPVFGMFDDLTAKYRLGATASGISLTREPDVGLRNQGCRAGAR